jgi:hypothetical protein
MAELPRLLEIANRMRKELDIRDRSYFWSTYKDCFVGEDAVTWMVETGVAGSITEALDIGNQLQTLGFLEHVVQEHQFKNKPLFYR